jgi:hypothetical protein
MSNYRVCQVSVSQHTVVKNVKFDNKEDAEHYAKNQSASDDEHSYEIQKNHQGEFSAIKSYLQSQEMKST